MSSEPLGNNTKQTIFDYKRLQANILVNILLRILHNKWRKVDREPAGAEVVVCFLMG